jgi:hypothetical protein
MRLDNQELNFNFIDNGENIIRCSNVEEAFFNIFNITFDEQTSLLKSADKYIDGCPIIKLNVEHNNSVYEDIEFKVVVSENETPCVFINENSLQNGYFFEPFENPSSVLQEQIELLADVVESSVEDEELVNEEIDWQELKQQSKQIQENKIAHLIKQVEHQLSSRIDESLHDARQGILAESINIQSQAQNSIEQKIENHTQHLNALIEQWEQAAEAKISNYIINAIDETRCSIEEQFEVAVQEQQQDSLAVLSEKIAIIAIESKQAIADELVQIIEHQSNLLQETVATADDNIKQHVAQKLNEFKASITQNNEESFDAGVAGFINKQTEWLQQFVEGKIANVQESLEQSTMMLEQKQDALAQKLTHHASEIVAGASSKIIEQSKTLHQEQLQNVRQCVDEVISEQIAALQPTTEIIVTEARNTQKNLFKDAIGSIKTQISSEMQAHVANLQQDIYKKFAIYAESYAGGGSVAVQYAKGGTMNGSLNITNGQILSGGIDISTFFGGGGTASGAYLPLSGGTLTGTLNLSSADTLRSALDNTKIAFTQVSDADLITTFDKDQLQFGSVIGYTYGIYGRSQFRLQSSGFFGGDVTDITPGQVSLGTSGTSDGTDSLLNSTRLSFNDSNFESGFSRTVNLRSNTYNQVPDTVVDIYLPITNGTLVTEPRSDVSSWGWSDAMFFRDEANAIAQRNSFNAQTFRVYNTFTDSSNYERGFNRWRGSTFSASISGTILTLTVAPVGTFALGQRITGTSVTVGTIIVSQATGSLGVVGSTYNINISQTRTARTMYSYSDVFEIGTEKSGAGLSARPISFLTDGVERLNIGAAGGITSTNTLSTTNVIYASGGNSNQWNTTYSTVQTNSASWNPAGSYLSLSGGTLSGAVTIGNAENLVATPTNLLTLRNTTSATSAVPVQVSPALLLEGQGWKTTATAASQSVRFRQSVLPIQGTTAPAGMLVVQSDINNTNTWTNRLGIGFGSTVNGLYTETGGGIFFAGLAAGNQNNVGISGNGIAQLNLHCNGGITHSLINNASQGYIQALNTGGFAWSSTSTAAGTADLILLRSAAATLQLGINNATTATNQTIKAHNVTTGTGANLILNGGTGSVASGIVTITSPTYSGGTTTTTKPTFLVEPTGATSTNWSTNGTLIGANALSAFVGNLIDAQINGVSRFAVTVSSGWTAGGNVIINPNFGGAGRVKIGGTGGAFLNPSSVFSVGSTTLIGWTATSDGAGNSAEDLILRRDAAASLQLGTNALSGTDQTIKACNGTAGPGADLILKGGTGTTTNGNVRFGTHSALAAEVISGYITIKDESGTLRKIAVIS